MIWFDWIMSDEWVTVEEYRVSKSCIWTKNFKTPLEE